MQNTIQTTCKSNRSMLFSEALFATTYSERLGECAFLTLLAVARQCDSLSLTGWFSSSLSLPFEAGVLPSAL